MIYNSSIQEDRKRAETRFESLINNGRKFELKEVKPMRTLNQNSYLHVLFSLYGVENGYTLIESKSLVKRSCPFMVYESNGIKFVKETSKLDVQEMIDFIEWFRDWSGQQGCYLPSVDEYKSSHDHFNREIERCSNFL